MTSREYKYHKYIQFYKKFGCFGKIIKCSAYGFNAAIAQPNFGMFIPTDIARNSDGSPKQVNDEFTVRGGEGLEDYSFTFKMWDALKDIR